MKELLKAKSKFRKKGVALIADKQKTGGGGSWKFAGEDNLLKTIQEPLAECDLEVIPTMEDDITKVTLFHINSGENISSWVKLPPITPKLDSRGNPLYLDAEIERAKQHGYWSRIQTMKLLGLSDIDPEDIKNIPEDISNVKLRKELENMIKKSTNIEKTKEGLCKVYKVSSIDALPSDKLNHIINLLKKKQNNENKAS